MKHLLLLLLLLSQVSQAEVSVAFFRAHTAAGEIIQLEADGQFFHVAVQLEDGSWIHTHPKNGVEIISHLDLISGGAVVLTHSFWPAVQVEEVRAYLGQPFDFQYNWDDPNSTYCSKLVGKILGIQPKPMSFSEKHWDLAKNQMSIGLGLSPDDIYSSLVTKGFITTQGSQICADFLNSSTISQLQRAKSSKASISQETEIAN